MSGVRDCSTCKYGQWDHRDAGRCERCDAHEGRRGRLWFPRKRYQDEEPLFPDKDMKPV